jgi:DNA polymerase II small subunit
MAHSIRSKYHEVLRDSWDAKASDYATNIELGAPVGQSRRAAKLENIINLFSERYKSLRKILRQQCGFRESHSISEASRERKRYKTYHFIGMVMSTRRTKSGGRMVELEDPTGTIDVFVRADDPASQSLMNDDVVGISGTFGKDGRMFWVNRVQFAEVLMHNENKGGVEYDPVSIAFISDIHMGSKYFLEQTWDKMMHWMNTDDLAKNIKYLVLSGDCVDGAGIYPGQERNLVIDDAYDQYEFCARKLDELPDHITPIMLPGNHDAVRPAEPQPVLEHSIQQRFNSTIHVGNPGRVGLNGIDLLAYHGKGMDDLIPRMDHVTYDTSVEGMKEMLKHRHLAPSWGERNALSLEEDDQLIIKDIPDVFVTGHTHSHAFEWHRGIPMIVSSTMQGQTDFMNMLGFASQKGHLTLYNIQNREGKVVSFHANDDVDFK